MTTHNSEHPNWNATERPDGTIVIEFQYPIPQDGIILDGVNAYLQTRFGEQAEIDWRDPHTCWIKPQEYATTDECWSCAKEIDLDRDEYFQVTAFRDGKEVIVHQSCRECAPNLPDPNWIYDPDGVECWDHNVYNRRKY